MRGKRVSSMRMPTVKPYWLKPPRTRPVVMATYCTPPARVGAPTVGGRLFSTVPPPRLAIKEQRGAPDPAVATRRSRRLLRGAGFDIPRSAYLHRSDDPRRRRHVLCRPVVSCGRP